MTAALLVAAPATVALRPAPRREPPFDDEVAEPVGPSRFEQRLPMPAAERSPYDPVPLDPALPDPGRWARSLLIGVIETAGGKRPLQQLAAMFSLSVSSGLGRDFERSARMGKRHWTAGSTVRSVRASRTSESVAEVSATLQCGTRVHAAALRLECQHDRWRCTKLQLG